MGGIGSGRKKYPLTIARHEEWRAYKAEGHSLAEVSEHFGISRKTATKVCKGIAPQVITSVDAIKQREQRAIEIISKRIPMFEYVGGYSSFKEPCQIRCKVCGSEATRSFEAIRHGKVKCAVCAEREREEREQAKRAEADAKQKGKERARALREEVAERERQRKEEERKAKIHPCVICGEPTVNKHCCSASCSAKYYNQQHESKRRVKIKSAMVDKDITLQKLFMRDNGVCHLCGGLCNWDDKEERNGTIICGNEYPSIDHVMPLSKGGMHSWDNVKLAHRLCNTCKSDKIISPCRNFVQ